MHSMYVEHASPDTCPSLWDQEGYSWPGEETKVIRKYRRRQTLSYEWNAVAKASLIFATNELLQARRFAAMANRNLAEQSISVVPSLNIHAVCYGLAQDPVSCTSVHDWKRLILTRCARMVHFTTAECY